MLESESILTMEDGRVHALADSPPAHSGRRKSARPVNVTVYYATHLMLGLLTGTSLGCLGAALAAVTFREHPALLTRLWWLVLLVGLAALALVKAQMDSIRNTVYIRRKGDKVEHLRIRRRHEVVATLARRVLIALVLSFFLLAGMDYCIRSYGPSFGISAQARMMPGADVFLVLYALGLSGLVMGACELTLRLTQKAGFRYPALWLFIPALLGCAASIRLIMSMAAS